ncbi:MAG TPA: hypothetical protein VGR00_02475, partial [Thermoanaerobaculia bacterium]|nr:hypothetical protein [Thermoanaerobaculia bacterium]
MHELLLRRVATALLALFGLHLSAAAATHTWSGTTNTLWGNAGNWQEGTAPSAAEASVALVFPATLASGRFTNVNNVSNLVIQSITFQGGGYAITGVPLSLSGGLVYDAPSGSSSNNLALGISLAAPQVWSVTNTNVFDMVGQVSGPGDLTKDGSGFLNLFGLNSYTGLTTVTLGTIGVNGANALGNSAAGTSVAAGGIVSVNGAFTVLEPLTLAVGATLTNVGNNEWAGPITLPGTGSSFLFSLTNTLTISGLVSGTGGFMNLGGSAPVTLTANNTYTGATQIRSGAVFTIDGNQPGSSANISTQSTLGGSGIVGPITATTGTIAPGHSPGILSTTGGLLLSPSSTVAVELNGTTPGSGYDRIAVTGSVALSSATLTVTAGFTPSTGDAFTIVDNDGADAVVGTFAGLPEGATFAVSG